MTAPVTPETLTDAMIRDLLDETGGIVVAGRECCELILHEQQELDGAADHSDEAYYGARQDIDLAKQYVCAAINARAKEAK